MPFLRNLRSCCTLKNAIGRMYARTCLNSDYPILSIAQGKIRGVKRQTVYNDDYYSFEGIPFAKPPLQELRFAAPLRAEGWLGIYNATQVAHKPVQKNYIGKIEGDEDCLYINVYVKTLESDALPVMVWIYGGGFSVGEGSRKRHGPDYLMRKNIIMVSFNYRVHVLGFLSLNDPELHVPGNAGLKDQVLALKWVKENIASFNGDENNITLFGESAGGASAHYMTLTQQTQGLFQKAIIMSGCVLNNWANMPQADYAYRLARRLGYKGIKHDGAVLAYLRKLSAKKLVEREIMTDEERRKGYMFLFAPTIEPYIEDDCVIPKAPFDMMHLSWGNHIPMILGGTSSEGLLMYAHIKQNPDAVEKLINDPEPVLPLEVMDSNHPEVNMEMATKLISTHFGNSELGEISMENKLNYLDLLAHKVFWHGFHRTALSRLVYGSAPTYLYRFDFDSDDFNFHRNRYVGCDPVRGAAHADDLSYLFLLQESWKLDPESPEWKTVERMVGMWTAFAKNSNPNCKEIKPVVWQPLRKYEANCALNISKDVEMIELPEKNKFEVWDGLYKRGTLY